MEVKERKGINGNGKDAGVLNGLLIHNITQRQKRREALFQAFSDDEYYTVVLTYIHMYMMHVLRCDGYGMVGVSNRKLIQFIIKPSSISYSPVVRSGRKISLILFFCVVYVLLCCYCWMDRIGMESEESILLLGGNVLGEEEWKRD